MHAFSPSGRPSTDERKCFPSLRKKTLPPLGKVPPNGQFYFFQFVNELGSLIHTLSKSTQMLLASSEAPVEAIGKIIFSEIADWHGINTHDLGLFSTMHY